MAPKTKVVTRGYNVDYLKYGFITSPNDERQPLCLICKKTFSNEAMKPSRMKEHLQRVHPEKQNSDIIYFRNLHRNFATRSTITSLFKSQTTLTDAGLQASYEIASLIAKNGKPHTIGESLIIPAIEVVMKTMLKKDSHEVISNLPLSNNSVSRRINEMACDVEQQLIHKLQKEKFALQVDESVIRDNEAILMAYVRYIDGDEIKEEFLFARNLTSDSTAKSIFDTVTNFFNEKAIPLENMSACATDGAPAMMGRHTGFLARLKELLPGLFAIHCIIHREHLVAKELNGCLHDAMQLVIRAINFIKVNSKYDRLFRQLCISEDESFVRLLLHTEVRWLSKGKCLSRFAQLYDTICEFLSKYVQFEHLQTCPMKQRIFYLTDIFDKLNQLNLDLQGKQISLIHCKTKVLAFLGKLELWRRQLENRIFSHFPLIGGLTDDISDETMHTFTNHLILLKDNMNLRYADLCNLNIPIWTSLPFDADPSIVHVSQQEELMELMNDAEAKSLFSLRGYQQMWITMRKKYPNLWKDVELVFLAFPTTYLVEAGFSVVTNLLSKKRNRLNICFSGDLRLCLTNFSPDIHNLTAKHQAQGSH